MQRVQPALLDALENETLPKRGCALMAAVVQQRLMKPSALHPLLEPESTLPNRRLYLAVAGDIGCGAPALLEVDFFRLARAAKIPAPIAQAVRVEKSGRRRYLDADFDGFAVEVDGAVHLRPTTWWDDMFRQNEIVIGGRPVLRFASVAFRLDRRAVVDQLRRAHARYNRPR